MSLLNFKSSSWSKKWSQWRSCYQDLVSNVQQGATFCCWFVWSSSKWDQRHKKIKIKKQRGRLFVSKFWDKNRKVKIVFQVLLKESEPSFCSWICSIFYDYGCTFTGQNSNYQKKHLISTSLRSSVSDSYCEGLMEVPWRLMQWKL